MTQKFVRVGLTALVLVSAFGGLLWYSLQQDTAYYKHVEEVMTSPAEWEGKALQLHGYVVPGSILRGKSDQLEWRFKVQSKGSMVATSNFLNVTGGLVAVVVFYFVTYGLQVVFGLSLTSADVGHSEAALREYIDQLTMAERIPTMLFISASLITAAVLVLLCWQRPDFLLRALSWLRIPARRHLKAINADHLPANEPLIAATNCERLEQWMHVVAVLDRLTRFVPDKALIGQDAVLARVARRLGVSLDPPQGDEQARQRFLARAAAALVRGEIVAFHIHRGHAAEHGAELFSKLQSTAPVSILPVYCGEFPAQQPGAKPIEGRMSVVVGDLIPATSTVEEAREAIDRLGR
jgi:hypothetical protein